MTTEREDVKKLAWALANRVSDTVSRADVVAETLAFIVGMVGKGETLHALTLVCESVATPAPAEYRKQRGAA